VTELERLLETPVPVTAPVLWTLLVVVMGHEAWCWYRRWQFGRMVRAAALKAINAPVDEVGIISLHGMSPEEVEEFRRQFNDLVSSEKCGKKVDLN
jgi:hypothetical protein